MKKLSIFHFILVALLAFAPFEKAYSQQFPAIGNNQAIVVYSLETEAKKLRHFMSWAPFDPETGLYIGVNQIQGDKHKTLMNRFRGEEIFEGKRDGKKVKKVFFEIITPGTYVLHSVFGKDAMTTYHPLTIGFTAKPGDVIYIGDFSVNQKGDSFRSLIDPNTGVTLEYYGADLGALELDPGELEKNNIGGLKDYLKPSPPVFFEVREYQ